MASSSNNSSRYSSRSINVTKRRPNDIFKFMHSNRNPPLPFINYNADTIHIREIYSQIEKMYLKSFLEKTIGPVSDVYIFRDNKQSEAFVTFNSPQDALRAIRHRKLKLTAIDNGITMAHPRQLVDYQINHHVRPSILHLNDDCLLHVCQYLDLADIIRFSTTCERLKDIAELYCFKKYENLDTKKIGLKKEALKPIKFKVLLTKIGEYINTFIVSATDLCEKISHSTYLSIINLYCPNLTSLTLIGIKNEATNVVMSMVLKLKNLTLISCNLSLVNLIRIEKICNLQTFHVENDYAFDGTLLKFLTNLNEISFVNCKNLYPPYVGELFASNSIKSFTLINCAKFENSSRWFRDSIESIGCLEYLHTTHELFEWYGADEQKCCYPIERAIKLRKFHVPNVKGVVNIIAKLAEIDQLEVLDMSQCVIKDKKIRTALQYFTKIEILNLNDNVNVDDDLLMKLAKNCKLRKLHCRGSVERLLNIFDVVKLSSDLETLEIDGKSFNFAEMKKIVNLFTEQLNRPRLEIIIDSITNLNALDVESIIIKNSKRIILTESKIEQKRYDFNDMIPRHNHRIPNHLFGNLENFDDDVLLLM